MRVFWPMLAYAAQFGGNSVKRSFWFYSRNALRGTNRSGVWTPISWLRHQMRAELQIGLDLSVRGHGELLPKLVSLFNFASGLPITLGRGCVFNQSTRAAAVGSIPAFFHQLASSPQRWTSRWCPRHSGTVNSSLTLRPIVIDWAKRRWWASGGLRPQTRQAS